MNTNKACEENCAERRKNNILTNCYLLYTTILPNPRDIHLSLYQ
jgi:hypothetical protein